MYSDPLRLLLSPRFASRRHWQPLPLFCSNHLPVEVRFFYSSRSVIIPLVYIMSLALSPFFRGLSILAPKRKVL